MDTDTTAPPPSRRPRTFLLVLLGIVLVVGAVVTFRDSTGPATPTSNPRRPQQQAGGDKPIDPAELDLKLEALKDTPQSPGDTERNPFRFRPKPPPPPPPRSAAGTRQTDRAAGDNDDDDVASADPAEVHRGHRSTRGRKDCGADRLPAYRPGKRGGGNPRTLPDREDRHRVARHRVSRRPGTRDAENERAGVCNEIRVLLPF